MKEILDNWKQFLAEQKQSRKDEWGEPTVKMPDPIGYFPVRMFNYYRDMGFSSIKRDWIPRISQVLKIGNEMKTRLFNDFASERAIKSFIAHSRKKKGTTGFIDFFTPEKEVRRFYKEKLLPEIRKIINNVPIYAFYHPDVPAAEAMAVYETGDIATYFWDEQIIVINPFSKELQGSPNMLQLVFYEELAHAVDLQLDFRTAGDMFKGKPSKLSDVFGPELQKLFTPVADLEKMGYEDDEYIKYMRDPKELYAKLRTLKAYYEKKYSEQAFNPDGTIKKDFLEKGFDDPTEAGFLLDFFDIKKVDDLKKVIDQLVKVDKKMSKGSKMA